MQMASALSHSDEAKRTYSDRKIDATKGKGKVARYVFVFGLLGKVKKYVSDTECYA